MLSWLLGKRDKRPTYKEAREIAASDDAEARKAVAKFDDLEPELLYFFSNDSSPEVRQTVANNQGCPPRANLILSQDKDTNVRAGLVSKIKSMIPLLGSKNTKTNEKTPKAKIAESVLENLANDDLPEIRSKVSQELKDDEKIPKQIILKLARDINALVSSPVLEYSPLLESAELVSIISKAINPTALRAIAKRKNIEETVCEAVASTGDSSAVQTLLENQTAKIDQDTLHYISEIADDHENWHNALAGRSDLSIKTIKNLTSYVSETLVTNLIQKYDLPSDVLADIKKAVHSRLSENEDGPKKERYKKYHALIADQDRRSCEIQQKLLMKMGFGKVTIEEDGEDALDRIFGETSKFDLIITAWDLPTMSGLMVLREVRECKIETPYIFVTKNKNEENILAARKTGISEYILKPYDRIEYFERVSACLDKNASKNKALEK